MGFTTNSLQIESVTPDKAREFLSYNYAHNRRLRQNWVKLLANEMREGRFMQTAEIHIMYCNGEPVLVNGQHTCNAIVMYGKPVRLTVRKTSTNEHGQVAMMYAFGHDNGRKRTFNDGLGAYNVDEEFGLGPQQTKNLAAALKFIRNGFNSRNVSGKEDVSVVEILDAMPEWVPHAKLFWNHAFAPEGELSRVRKAIQKQSILSVLLVTYRYSLPEAKAFWSGILSPGLLDTDPRWYARRSISESIAKSNQIQFVERMPEVVARRIAKCWNSFVIGKRMAQIPRLRDIDQSAPIVITGTPYTGRQPAPPWWPSEER